MDFWWDGQGVGSCWQHPSAAGSEPLVLPECGANNLPAGLGTARYVGEPGKVLKLYTCANYSQRSQRIPVDCDWFGARGLDRIEVKYALGEAVLLGVLLLALWMWRLRGSRPALFAALLSCTGLTIGVFGTIDETTPLSAIGLTLFGVGLVPIALFLRRSAGYGLSWLTYAVAVFALLGGIDRGLFMLPLIPVPPSVLRVLVEVVWVPWALGAVIRARAGRRSRRISLTRPDPAS
jgi:hypothetical protein